MNASLVGAAQQVGAALPDGPDEGLVEGPREGPLDGPHVHVRVGSCDIAVPIAHVRQALPLPPEGLTVLPRRSGGLLGMADAAGAAVPIVDLARWLQMGADDNDVAQPRLLILQHDGLLVGIKVDAVLGVKAVAAGAARRAQHAAADGELFEAVVPASAHHPILCILEVARLMQLSQSWCADVELAPAKGDAPAAVAEGAGTRSQRHAVFEIGTELWAVPVSAIVQVVPVPEVELSLGRSERSWAISQWQGRKLPLVDISASRSASNAQQAPWMVLLQQGAMVLGLTVSACKQFVDLAEDTAARPQHDALLAGIAVLPELGKLNILDTAKLFQLTPEAAVSLQTTRTAAVASATTVDAVEPTPYMVFTADQRYATPVAGIIGVIELPPQAIDDLRSGQAAALAWRGRTISVVNLPAIGKQTSTDDPRLAVLVQPADDDAPPLGIAIKSLSDWLPAHSARRTGMRMGAMGELSLINAPGSTENASLVVVDLAQMAHLLS